MGILSGRYKGDFAFFGVLYRLAIDNSGVVRPHLRCGCGGLLAILLFASGPSEALDWPTVFGNKERTGTISDGRLRYPVKKWEYYMGADYGGLWSSPIVIGTTLYQGTNLGSTPSVIRSLHAWSGAPIWQSNVTPPNVLTLTYEEGYLYYGQYSNTCLGVKMRESDRSIMWQFTINESTSTTSSILPAGSLTYVLLNRGKQYLSATLYCLDNETGSINWGLSVTPPDGETGYTVSWHDGVVFVPGTPFFAIRDNAGFPDVKWTHTWPRDLGEIAGNPAVANGKVYCMFQDEGTGMGNLEVMDEDTGELEWRLPLPNTIGVEQCLVDGLRIYVRSATIYAIDDLGSSGSIVWKRHIPSIQHSWSVVADGTLVVSSSYGGENHLSRLRETDGSIFWSREVDQPLVGSMAYSDGLLYCNSQEYIYCFGPPLKVHLSVDKETAVPGDLLTYTITINTYGEESGGYLKLFETIPAEVEFVSASDGGMIEGSVVGWPPFPIVGDALREVTVIAQVRSDLDAGEYIAEATANLVPTKHDDVAASTGVIVFPQAPGNLAAMDACPGVGLAWNVSPSTGIGGYRIYRSFSSGSGRILIAALPASASVYFDTGVEANKAYFYVLTAYAGDMESEASNEVNVQHASCGEPLAGHIRVFPNPYGHEAAVRGTVKFEVSSPAAVRVYTSRGLMVWEGEISSPGIIEWDGKNEAGKRVSPAVYLWVAESEDWKERGTLIVE